MSEYKMPALYRVSGKNSSDGPWSQLIKANSPMDALAHAVTAKSWDILAGVHIAIEVNFYDLVEHQALAASTAAAAKEPSHEQA